MSLRSAVLGHDRLAAERSRHLLVVLGEVEGPEDLDRWEALYVAVDALAGVHRRRVTEDRVAVSVTVWGPSADVVITALADIARQLGALEVTEVRS